MPLHLALLKSHWHRYQIHWFHKCLIWYESFFCFSINNYIIICLFLQCSLASYITDNEIRKGILFPEVSRWVSPTTCTLLPDTFIQSFLPTDGWLTSTEHCSIRHITARVGAAVVRAAVAEDLAEGCCDVGPRELGSMSEVLHKNWCHVLIVKTYSSVWTKFIVLLTVGNGGLRRSENVVPYLQPPCERQINRAALQQMLLTFHSEECIRFNHLFWLPVINHF